MLKVDISGDAEARLNRARSSISFWVISATGDIAREGADYIKDRYLRGRALDRITGTTAGSVKQFYDKKEKSWYIRPGVGIRGSLNYLARWTGTRREFMQTGFNRFLASRNVEAGIVRDLEKKL